jgi:N-acyl-D-aspartate/D-glutamate deacylase
MADLDLVVRNGMVIDGTGGAPLRADVGISGGRVVTVGTIPARAGREIDADGRVVAPGVVDIHTHYDAQLFWDGAATPSSLHGVTTVVGGNCGFSIAPLAADQASYLAAMLARVEGMSLPSLEAGVPWDWSSFGQYLDRLEGSVAVNAGFLVGHTALRRAVLDIPGTQLSSGFGNFLVAVAPCGVFVVGDLVCEAAVEDADESVAQGS